MKLNCRSYNYVKNNLELVHNGVNKNQNIKGKDTDALFENDLYLEIGKHENECADILRKGFKDKGYKMYIESPSNQIFSIVDQQTLEKINKNYITTYMFKIDDQHTCIRLVTSWATSKEICEQFIEEL